MKPPKTDNQIYDLIGVGVGPFNLSLASLLAPIESVNSIFFDSQKQFDWHAGLLMEDCDLQVPFMADMVTMADPTSPYSYVNYLHEHGRLYQFYFYDNFQIPRIDYNLYCRWVSEKLTSVKFSQRVINIEQDGKVFYVTVKEILNNVETTYTCRNIVLGTGSSPSWPSSAAHLRTHTSCIHSAQYKFEKNNLQKKKSITIIGSGQSAAEIFLDLLKEENHYGYKLNWLSRSHGFFPMEHSKLGLEHFSPEYIDHFHSLPEQQRDNIRSYQNLWYKGISNTTISEIYNQLYKRSFTQGNCNIALQARSQLEHIECVDNKFTLSFQHLDKKEYFNLDTDSVVLATGYQHLFPDCLNSLKPLLQMDTSGRPVINRNYTMNVSSNIQGKIYVQNAELHTHGIGAPDLGLGAYRSAMIINQLLNKEHYTIRRKNVFQQFGIDEHWQKKSHVEMLSRKTVESASQRVDVF